MQRETLRLYRGDDYAIALTLRGRDGRAVNLTGVRADLHAAVAGETVLRMSTADSRIRAAQTPDGTPVLLIDFAHDLTAAADWQAADYDLQLTDAQGRIRTIMRGQIKLTGDITPAVPSDKPATANTVRAAHPVSADNSDSLSAAPAAWTACTHIVIDLDDTQTVYLPADASGTDLLALYNIAKS